MSPLTKVLVVLVTVLSVLQLGLFVAYSSKHTRLSQDITTLKSELAVAKVRAKGAQAEVAAAQDRQSETVAGLNHQVNSLTAALNDALTKRRDAEASISTEKARSAKTEEAIARLTASSQQDANLREAMNNELMALRNEVVDQRTKNVELSDANNELTSSLNSLERKARWYAESLTETNQKLESAEKMLADAGLSTAPANGNDTGPVTASAPIAGKITEVDSSTDVALVAVNVGANDGVASGMEFMVHRGDQYVGKLVIENVDADVSAGRMILVRGAVQADDAVYAGPY